MGAGVIVGVAIAGGSDAPVEIGDPRIEFKAAPKPSFINIGSHDKKTNKL